MFLSIAQDRLLKKTEWICRGLFWVLLWWISYQQHASNNLNPGNHWTHRPPVTRQRPHQPWIPLHGLTCERRMRDTEGKMDLFKTQQFYIFLSIGSQTEADLFFKQTEWKPTRLSPCVPRRSCNVQQVKFQNREEEGREGQQQGRNIGKHAGQKMGSHCAQWRVERGRCFGRRLRFGTSPTARQRVRHTPMLSLSPAISGMKNHPTLDSEVTSCVKKFKL